MRTRTIAGVAAAALVVGGVAALARSDFLQTVADDAVLPVPSPTASRGPLDPAAWAASAPTTTSTSLTD
ncbi:hypothetical protein [Streptosporangium sp. NPDC000396]|uniref:hypothetical protein n=1 Tax=Streptosporangium sp. NPDC000396 TaxID=3366185 RepID=UPI003687F4D8